MAAHGQQIFIFTAGDPAARAHLQDSITQPLDLQKVLANSQSENHHVFQKLHDDQGLYAWGAVPGKQNKPRWESMNPGDWVLCVFASTYRFVAQVKTKLENKELANAIWGSDSAGNTWSLIHFLSKPLPINVPVRDLADQLNKGYMGFTRISEDRVQALETNYGSVKAFVDQRLINVPTESLHPLNAIKRDDVLDALIKIKSGDLHGFGPSFDYDLLHEGERFSPKAAVGIATFRTLRRTLRPDEFSAGVGSKTFQVLQTLGFEVVPAGSKEGPTYFVIRSNSTSPYHDELGTQYHFNTKVPNHKKLMHGGYVVVDSKSPSGVVILGFGMLAPASLDKEDKGIRDYVAKFEPESWQAFLPPRKMTQAVLEQIKALPNYNVQHAIKPINETVFKLIVDDVIDEEVPHMEIVKVHEPAPEPLDLQWLVDRTGLDKEVLSGMVEAILGPSPQIMLAGPPGTSKTWVARQLALFLTRDRTEQVRFVQFHPSYSYESFLEGLRPTSRSGGISFERQDGVVLELAKQIRAKGATENGDEFVLVIDEANRANLPRVLGELMFLFEYRDEAIRLQYSEQFSLPKNLRFIATMNTADRSIRSVDVALRRRFDVFELLPDANILRRHFNTDGNVCHFVGLVEGLEDLNLELEKALDRHHTIGHAFFMRKDLTAKDLRHLWRRKIFPLIEEFFFDQPELTKEFSIERFWPNATNGD